MAFKKRIYRIIEAPYPEDWKGKFFDNFMMVLIVTNVLAVILETVESLAAAYGIFFQYFEYFSVAVFSVEYVLRLWTAGESENERFHPPVMGRLRYAMTPMALIDAVAILPFYLAFFLPFDLRFMRVFRLFRLLKLTRYSAALQTLGAAVYGQRRALGATLVIIAILLVFSSSIIYLLEKDAQPEAFGSIPEAMWWGLATLTTVGYGDIAPISAGGKVFGAFVMVLGIGMFALPAGILATAFSNEIRKREFVVTWNMVASVPFFSRLDAPGIAEIVDLLELSVLPAHATIIERGGKADAMYFISLGEVEVDLRPEPQRLGPGDFFGEIALLKETDRTATVTTITECEILVLGVDAFKRLLASNPELRDILTQVMDERLAVIEEKSRGLA